MIEEDEEEEGNNTPFALDETVLVFCCFSDKIT